MSDLNRIGKQYKGITWVTFPDYCKGCGLCIEKCPKKCLKFSKNDVNYLGTPSVECKIEECIACKTCETTCPDTAIVVEGKKR